jgi:hypothetical protein
VSRDSYRDLAIIAAGCKAASENVSTYSQGQFPHIIFVAIEEFDETTSVV